MENFIFAHPNYIIMKIKHFLTICYILVCGFFMPGRVYADGSYVPSNLFESLKSGDKAALLLVHFGTTYDETRALTIDAINQKAQAAFPELEFREAYTSRVVINRLAKKGIRKMNPIEALAQLKADGYTHVVVQSTHIINGTEISSLREDIAKFASLFKEVRLGAPLLSSTDDYKQVVGIMAKKGKEKTVTMLVGHGTNVTATAQYAMLDYVCHAEGHADFIVGTVEGYPSFDDAVNRLQEQKKIKQVQLIPFLFVAGDHANNDIAVEMKQALEEKGYQVSVVMEGLGQNPEIQDLFIDHIRFSIDHKEVSPSDKKKGI